MPPLLERLIGIALIVSALIGLVINVIALVYIPQLTGEAEARARTTLGTLDGTLETTAEALVLVDQALSDVQSTSNSVESATRETASALGDTVPLFSTLADITGRELPASLSATQLALGSAEEGAASVEQTLFDLNSSLETLASIPLLNIDAAPVYNPTIPLATTIRTVSNSLRPLSESLDEIETNFITAERNLRRIQTDVEGVAENLGAATAALEDGKQINAQYKAVVAEQQALVGDLQANAGTWIVWGGRAVLALLLWLAIAQLGLLSQGVEMVLRSRQRHAHG